ncbi:MAG: cytochrome P450 [Cryobacterium sp.]|nr:cytochrome P450 [Oligoflexia bacterium]
MNGLRKKVFVTGGNGFLGSRTVKELIEKGYRVRCLLRPTSDLRRLENLPFEAHLGDIRDLESVKSALSGCDFVIHLAGPSSWDKISNSAPDMEEDILTGSENVFRAASASRVLRVVYVSSVAAVHGSHRPEVADETHPYVLGPLNLNYSRFKHHVEELAKNTIRDLGLDIVIVNPGETYGPTDTALITAGNLVSLLGPVSAVVCEGGASICHVDDVARGIVLALEKGRRGERYILAGENLTLAEIAKTVRVATGRSERVLTLPTSTLRFLTRLCLKFGLTPPVSPDVLSYAALYWYVDSKKAEKELGYVSRPARETLTEVAQWLQQSGRLPAEISLRYGRGAFDLRSALIRMLGVLQKKRVVILDDQPRLCSAVLAASDRKGSFIESLFATPAWKPIYSIESMDGEIWEQLSRDFRKLMSVIQWRENLPLIAKSHLEKMQDRTQSDPTFVIGAEEISRVVLRILYRLLFENEISPEDESLFYQASLTWRKEIALKGRADPKIKNAFWKRLEEIVASSSFHEGLESYRSDPARWLSLFAQPFLISPQINIADIFVSIFSYLRRDPEEWERSKQAARESNRSYLDGIVLEAIRLKHPFPVLERELKKDLKFEGKSYQSGTQFFILMDQLKQDPEFKPSRWDLPASENPYHHLPFAAGPRMCVGKPIALELMFEILKTFLISIPDSQIEPGMGHLYSGRDNDGSEGAAELKYQAEVFSKAIWQSFRIGRRVRKVKSEGGCPFTGRSG